MNIEDIKEYIGDKRISIKNIAKHFSIKRRVLYRFMKDEPGIDRVFDPLLHGSYKSKSRCWALTKNIGTHSRR
mgnify:CR=1 FL=1